MSAAAPPPAIPSATAGDVDPNDPLGYDAYAKTLWARIDHALNRDAITGKLGDDPLVIGLFGEWGVGKTYLLDKIRDHATRYATERAELRRNDGGFDLTIPVYFQPWKYEHEEHLHVPLLLHTLKALEEGVKQSQTLWERVGQAAQKPGDAIVKALPKWRDHALTGEWSSHRECHMGGDFLLIYRRVAYGKGGMHFPCCIRPIYRFFMVSDTLLVHP